MKDKLKALLARVEATRSTLDGAVSELEELEQELKVLINGPTTWGAKHLAKSRGKMPKAEPKAEPKTRPLKRAAISADLQDVPCPKCGGPMRWRWSEAKGANFAGCVRFPDCRGARSEAEVREGAKRVKEPRATRAYCGACSAETTRTDDGECIPCAARDAVVTQRLVAEAKMLREHFDDVAAKHHGPDAPTKVALANGEAFEGLDGHVHPRDDGDDFGVPF